jgi:hypothetical protein
MIEKTRPSRRQWSDMRSPSILLSEKGTRTATVETRPLRNLNSQGRTNNHLACPFQYQSGEHREKSEST